MTKTKHNNKMVAFSFIFSQFYTHLLFVAVDSNDEVVAYKSSASSSSHPHSYRKPACHVAVLSSYSCPEKTKSQNLKHYHYSSQKYFRTRLFNKIRCKGCGLFYCSIQTSLKSYPVMNERGGKIALA